MATAATEFRTCSLCLRATGSSSTGRLCGSSSMRGSPQQRIGLHCSCIYSCALVLLSPPPPLVMLSLWLM